MHLIMAESEVIWFMREWDQLKAQGKVLSELLDEAVLSEILNETPLLREDLLSTLEINRHQGQFQGFTVEVDTIAQLINTGDLSNLRVLDLSQGPSSFGDRKGEVGVRGATALGKAIATGRVPFLHTIDLWGNPIGEAGIIAVATALKSGAVSSLKRLAIGACRAEESEVCTQGLETHEAVKALAGAFASGHVSSLEQLSLYKVVHGEEGLKLLMIGLREGGVAELKRLQIQGTEFISKLRAEGVMAITNSLFFSSLVELDLSGNRIEDDGVLALVEAFRSTRVKHLEILDMDHNTMSDRVLVDFVKMLEEGHLPGLLTLRLGPTHFTVLSAKALVRAYKKNKDLVVEMTYIDWPRAAFRDAAYRYRNENLQRAEDSLKAEIAQRKLVKVSSYRVQIENCFGWSYDEWRKLP